MLVGCDLCRYGAAAPTVQVKYIILIVDLKRKEKVYDKEMRLRVCHICIKRLQEAIDERWK